MSVDDGEQTKSAIAYLKEHAEDDKPLFMAINFSKDGQVYRNNGGNWQKADSGGSWSGLNDASRTQSLSAEQGARANGNFRSSGFGGFDRGGAGAGAFRGGGGFRGGRR